MKRSRTTEYRREKVRRTQNRQCCEFHQHGPRNKSGVCNHSDNLQTTSSVGDSPECSTEARGNSKVCALASENETSSSEVEEKHQQQSGVTKLEQPMDESESNDTTDSSFDGDTEYYFMNEHNEDDDDDENEEGPEHGRGGGGDGNGDGDHDNGDDDNSEGDSFGNGDSSGDEDNDNSDGGNVDFPHGGDPHGDSSDPDDPDEEEDPVQRNNFNFDNISLNTICQTVINCSAREVLAMLLAVSSKHRLTYDATINLFTCFNALYGRRYLPVDKKTLWVLLGRNEVGITKHVYCNNCFRGHGLKHHMAQQVVCPCGTVLKKKCCKYFIDLNLTRQLECLFKKADIRRGLTYRADRQLRVPNSMEDILDGSEYLRLRGQDNCLASDWHFSYTFNLDGFRLAKSSTSEAWPIYLRLNELPFKLRQKHMLLAGVWIDLEHPNMNLFLEPFVNQANRLSNDGFLWRPEGLEEDVTSKFFPTCCVVDAQARCAMLNFTTPTGYCGCPFCNHRGLHIGGAVHFPILPPIPLPERRTDNDIRRCMIAAGNHEGGRDGHVLGFHGPSQLMLMNHFNLSKGVVTDDMHPLAGVAEHHTNILLTRTREHRPPYFIGDSVARIDGRLKTIRTPSHISRKPRSLKRRKKWKSSEWRNWLLYYMYPCLDRILPRRYLWHFQLLAQAVFLLSKVSVTEEDCNEAQHLLQRYVELFERYFGPNNMRYNTHILLHLVDCVKEWGPLFSQSTSFFEGWNNTLLQTVTSPNAQADQIVTRFLMKRFLSNVEDNEAISHRIKSEVQRILENPRLRMNMRVENVILLGKKTLRAPNEVEERLLREHHHHPQEVIFFKRAEVDGIEYRTADYRYDGGDTKSDDSHIFTWNDEFGQITAIATFVENHRRRVVVFLSILNTNAQVNRYICKVSEEENEEVMVLYTFDDIQSHATLCSVPAAGTFIMPITNAWEKD